MFLDRFKKFLRLKRLTYLLLEFNMLSICFFSSLGDDIAIRAIMARVWLISLALSSRSMKFSIFALRSFLTYFPYLWFAIDLNRLSRLMLLSPLSCVAINAITDSRFS